MCPVPAVGTLARGHLRPLGTTPEHDSLQVGELSSKTRVQKHYENVKGIGPSEELGAGGK